MEILERNIEILIILKKNQPAGIISLSNLTKYPQHVVRYSLRLLSQDGLISPSQKGAMTTSSLGENMSVIKSKLSELHKRMVKILENI